MNKVSVLGLLVCISVILYTAQVSAIAIDFQPVDTMVNVGESFDVDVVVSGLSEAGEIVSTYDLFVGYDAASLLATGVTFGVFLDDFFFPSIQFDDISTPGEIEFGEISFLLDDELAALQPDSFTLATLSFDAIATGVTELLFDPHPFFGVNDIKGRDAQILTVNAGAGSVTVMVPSVSVPEPGSFMLFLLGFILLRFSPHRFSFRT